MKWTLVVLTWLGWAGGQAVAEGALPVVRRQGLDCVTARDLREKAGIAVKTLPGQEAVVACLADRCALVRDFQLAAGELWVEVGALAEALSLEAAWSDDRHEVTLTVRKRSSPQTESKGAVGELAPNFRLKRLDGRDITLAELRGRRVLINSWASW